MSVRSFETDWSVRSGKTPPFGYILRDRFYGRWTRFHALPKSKRYADSLTERECILRRAERIGNALFGQERMLWLATCEFKSPNEAERETQVPGFPQPIPFQHSLKDFKDEDGPSDWQVHALETSWNFGAFKTLFGELAEGRASAVWFDPATGRVLAPYDGGFDLILESRFRAAYLSERFRTWMSERKDRL